MLYESDDESNKIDLLYESPTTERNGVKIIIPVKYSDRGSFLIKIKEQLAYFENVYFDCQGQYENIKNEEVKIVRSEHFQWSSLVTNKTLHICLDNVYYPIDFEKLGIGVIHFPLGLRFSLTDGLFPVPNREQLKYTKEAKDIILNKIRLVADYFVTKYNDGIKDTNDILSIFDHFKNSDRMIPHFRENDYINVNNIHHHSKIQFISPNLNGVKLLEMKDVFAIRDYILMEYTIHLNYYNGRFTGIRRMYDKKLDLYKIEHRNIYLFSELSGLKKIYLREYLGRGKECYFIKKDISIPLGKASHRFTGRGLDSYCSLLNLYKHPKNEWRERIKEFRYMVGLLTSTVVDLDKMEIPAAWIEGRKKKRVEIMLLNGTNVRRKKLTGEISGKTASPLERYVSGKHCKFVPEVFKMNEAHKSGKFVIYGDSNSEELFQNLYTIFDRKKIKLVMLSEREMKNTKELELHNWMEIGKFMNGKHKVFRRAVTAYLINELRDEYDSVFNKKDVLKEISSHLNNKMTELTLYNSDYFLNGEKALYESMVKLAEEHNLFDTSIYDVYKEVKFILNRLPFIEPMFSRIGYDDSGMIKAIKDLFKYYKQRINWENYTLPMNESIEIAEEVKEEELIII